MKEDFENYFDAIRLDGAFREKANEIIDFYEGLYPRQLESIFVTEYVDNEGNRQYSNLSLFTSNFTFEAKNFLTQDNFDSTTIKNTIVYWELVKENYNFKIATQKSRMSLDFSLATGIHGNFRSSGKNCDFLRDIFKKHIIPNEIKNPPAINISAELGAL